MHGYTQLNHKSFRIGSTTVHENAQLGVKRALEGKKEKKIKNKCSSLLLGSSVSFFAVFEISGGNKLQGAE